MTPFPNLNHKAIAGQPGAAIVTGVHHCRSAEWECDEGKNVWVSSLSTCVYLLGTKHTDIQGMFQISLLSIIVTQTPPYIAFVIRNMDVFNRAPLLAYQDQGLMLLDERQILIGYLFLQLMM